MTWRLLLEAVYGLHRIGMSVPIALEEMARSEGASGSPAARWLSLRLQLGDPVDALRHLAAEIRQVPERLAAECLVICLERPAADHHRMLRLAREQARVEEGRSTTASLALMLVALASGEAHDEALARVTAVFGERRARAARSLLERAGRGAVPSGEHIQNALRGMRAPRRTVPLRAAALLALGMTLTSVSVLPASVEFGLVGW